MILTPEMRALFEHSAKNETHPLKLAMTLLFRELADVAPTTNKDSAELFHVRRRRLRSAMTRAYQSLAIDNTLSYEAQLIVLRHLLVALAAYDSGDTAGNL